MEKMKCEYFYKSDTVYLDLLTWAKKTFQTEIKHKLDYILKKCGLEGKANLPYIPTEPDNLHSMFVYITAIKYDNNLEKIKELANKLSLKCNINY